MFRIVSLYLNCFGTRKAFSYFKKVFAFIARAHLFLSQAVAQVKLMLLSALSSYTGSYVFVFPPSMF